MLSNTKSWRLIFALSLSILVPACSTVPEKQTEQDTNDITYTDERDPLEGVNRAIWDFNYNVLDKHVLRPTAVVYRDYMPTPARKGLLNVVNNLDEPSAFVNNTLQGKFANAGISAGRFLINSTLGLFGLFDIATPMGITEHQEDFGEVLGSYGVGNGPYLMVPAMGPTDVRDLSGSVVDGMYFPLSDLTMWGSIGRFTVKALEGRIQLMDQEQLLEDSFDSYIFVKEAHFQRSEFKVYDGNVPQEEEEGFDDFDDFEDEFDDEEFDESSVDESSQAESVEKTE
ncbi:VacJ family lipoprotein [Catenovulum sp. SM1970]|uniref:MlaA family lipoprotein n=1 Tax=Marinifaba aquimaris TaxID=2741323 RepID=UPI0015735F83|nr:VacJ family lipoprotein [Marinifaba aquimaris]NTS76358.1 VacJ family lipoprotein [Marinifaba aquimaris]